MQTSYQIRNPILSLKLNIESAMPILPEFRVIKPVCQYVISEIKWNESVLHLYLQTNVLIPHSGLYAFLAYV